MNDREWEMNGRERGMTEKDDHMRSQTPPPVIPREVAESRRRVDSATTGASALRAE
jgi:hypothetical protein